MFPFNCAVQLWLQIVSSGTHVLSMSADMLLLSNPYNNQYIADAHTHHIVGMRYSGTTVNDVSSKKSDKIHGVKLMSEHFLFLRSSVQTMQVCVLL